MKTPFSGTRRIFKGPQNSTCHIERIFKGPQNSRLHRLWTTSWGTRRIFRDVPCQKQHLPHRTHLQCAKQPPLSLFAPAPSTISFVPLTRNLSPAAPSLAPSTALGTRNRLLWYGICVPCSKRLPVVRGAFSGALGAQNRLLRYRRDIRCTKQPPLVRDAFGVKNRLLRYGRDIRCTKQAPVVRDASSKARRTADSTTTVNSLLPHRTHLQCAKQPPLGGEQT